MSVNEAPQPGMSGLMRWMIWVCCALMLVPFIIFFASGGSVSGASSVWGVLLPMALCIGVHVLLHRFTGASCHRAAPHAEDQSGPTAQPLSNWKMPVSGTRN